MPHIVGISGSLSHTSQSKTALEVALDSAQQAGASIELLDLYTLDIPIFKPMHLREPNEAVQLFCNAIRKADGLLWSTPLYHGSVSGAFKNAIDWLELLAKDPKPYLTDKPVGLICTAGGAQGLQAINTMEFVARALRAWVVPLTAPLTGNVQFPITEEHAQDRNVVLLQHLGTEIVRSAQLFSQR